MIDRWPTDPEQRDEELVRGLRSWARLLTDEELRSERHDSLWLLVATAEEDPEEYGAHPYLTPGGRDVARLRLAQLEAIEREMLWRAKKGLKNPRRDIGISRAVLDEIKARLPLADEIGSQIELRKRGRTMVGRCPFHNDRTPSLVVWPDNHCRCFGCQFNGDIFAWTQTYHRISFREAVEELARKAGVAL